MSRIPCAFSCSKEFLEKVDARAESLGMNRSQYIVQVLRRELFSDTTELSIVAEERDAYTVKNASGDKGNANTGS